MNIDKDLILRLEHLSRLELSAEEREGMIKDMKNILGMVETLQEVNTDQIEPLVYINEALPSNEEEVIINTLRKDEVKNELSIDEALKNAPKKDGNYFIVPKVIK